MRLRRTLNTANCEPCDQLDLCPEGDQCPRDLDYYDNTEMVETWKERKFRKFREKLNELGLKLPNYRTKNGNWLVDIGNAIEKMKNGN